MRAGERLGTLSPGLVSERPAPARSWESAIYQGRLHHHRFGPGPARAFSYATMLAFIDLDELPALGARHPLVSDHRPAPVWFRRADFLGPAHRPLSTCVRDLVEQRTGRRPPGPVRLLAHLRTWGWLFNPITLYFCYDEHGQEVEALVAEVENTPWHERTSYVVGGPGRHRFAKMLHVSPFLPMDVEYELTYTKPGNHFVSRMGVYRGNDRLFSAALALTRQPLGRAGLTRLAWSRAALAQTVSAGIYRQAGHLVAARAPFFKHPSKLRRTVGLH